MQPIKAFMPPVLQDPVENSIPTRLGWAVVQLWKDLPEDVRARIREQAGFVMTKPETTSLNEQIGIFLNSRAGKL
jgi:hypothetical protein